MLQMKHCRTLRTKAKQWDSGSHQFIQLTFSEDLLHVLLWAKCFLGYKDEIDMTGACAQRAYFWVRKETST